jgi:hypothetical protein
LIVLTQASGGSSQDSVPNSRQSSCQGFKRGIIVSSDRCRRCHLSHADDHAPPALEKPDIFKRSRVVSAWLGLAGSVKFIMETEQTRLRSMNYNGWTLSLRLRKKVSINSSFSGLNGLVKTILKIFSQRVLDRRAVPRPIRSCPKMQGDACARPRAPKIDRPHRRLGSAVRHTKLLRPPVPSSLANPQRFPAPARALRLFPFSLFGAGPIACSRRKIPCSHRAGNLAANRLNTVVDLKRRRHNRRRNRDFPCRFTCFLPKPNYKTWPQSPRAQKMCVSRQQKNRGRIQGLEQRRPLVRC